MGTLDERIRTAYVNLDRRLFMEQLQELAHIDGPLPIGYGQTISQPSLVLYMTLMLEPFEGCTVLEIGTGSGYQTALLASVVRRVFSVERIEPLYSAAEKRLRALGFDNVETRLGDGWEGWPEHAPYDRIIVTAAAPVIPENLLKQLAPAGIMIVPVGEEGAVQELLRVERGADGLVSTRLLEYVRFVPLVKAHQTI